MNHLSRSEFVDVAENRLGGDRLRHLDACADCRREALALTDTLAAIRTEDVPEPSPLFWDHLSARISEAIDHEPLPQPAWLRWLPLGRVRVAAAGLALVVFALLAGYVGWISRSLTQPPPSLVEQTLQDTETVDPDVLDASLPPDAWDVIAAAAGQLEIEEAHEAGLAPRPGPVERVTLDLTPQERGELLRLIEDEMKGNGS